MSSRCSIIFILLRIRVINYWRYECCEGDYFGEQATGEGDCGEWYWLKKCAEYINTSWSTYILFWLLFDIPVLKVYKNYSLYSFIKGSIYSNMGWSVFVRSCPAHQPIALYGSGYKWIVQGIYHLQRISSFSTRKSKILSIVLRSTLNILLAESRSRMPCFMHSLIIFYFIEM